MSLSDKAQYIRGLIDGLGIDDSTPEGKVIGAMSKLLEELCDSVDSIDADVDDVVDFCNQLDEDLSDICDFLSDDEDEDDCCDCDDECCDCDDAEEFEYSTVCPTCGDTIELTEEMVAEGEIHCPNCNEHLEFDLEGIEDDEE